MPESLSMPIELEFKRDENKFFVPQGFSKVANQSVEALCLSLQSEKEKHIHPITRSAYYYFGDTDSMPPGFSVRYREYVDKSLQSGEKMGKSETGFYEIKWLDQYEGARPTKRKIRIPGNFANSITLDSIREMAEQRTRGDQTYTETLPSLDKQLGLLARGGLGPLQPLFVVEYVRDRYIHLAGKKNIVSIDNDVSFYRVGQEDSTEGGFFVHPIGKIDGSIIEYKESSDDPALRWQLYRTLVKNNAVRFYGKKGEALNLLQRERSKDAPPIRNELPEFEVEAKLDVLTDIEGASEFVTDVFGYFNTRSQNFRITPGFHWINSQSTMAKYARDKANPDSEAKMLVGLHAKYSTKRTVEKSNGVIVRSENKGTQFEFNRAQAREVMRDKVVAGNTQRIRRAFYISSRGTERVYKVSIDFNWKLPTRKNDFFSQLEVEYTGIPVDLFDGPQGYTSETFTKIKDEVGVVRDEILQFMEGLGVPYKVGSTKGQMLTS